MKILTIFFLDISFNTQILLVASRGRKQPEEGHGREPNLTLASNRFIKNVKLKDFFGDRQLELERSQRNHVELITRRRNRGSI